MLITPCIVDDRSQPEGTVAPKQHIERKAEQAAIVVGLQALSYIATDEDLFGLFLDQAGTNAGDIRAQASDPIFLGFVLDFLLQEDRTVVGFAASQRMSPEDVLRARHNLPGGDTPNWT